MKQENKFMKEIFYLLCNMIISANELCYENKLYGPLRLIDSVSKLINILENNSYHCNFFSKIKNLIEENKNKVSTNEEEFLNFLDSLAQYTLTKINKLD